MPAFMGQARTALKESKTEEALANLRAVLVYDPENAGALLLESHSSFASGTTPGPWPNWASIWR